VAEDEKPVATVAVGSGANWEDVPVCRAELERGVLVGRYDRCDLMASTTWVSQEISRVHLLLLADGADVLAIDTGSTNGCTMEGMAFDVRRLGECADMTLASTLAVRWRVAGRQEPVEVPKAPRPRGDHRWMGGVRTWLAVLGVFALVAALIGSLRKESEQPRHCINPLLELGADSPALRLYLYEQDPDTCFTYKWVPPRGDWERRRREPDPAGPARDL
jgi:hypothetical protein